MTTASTSVLTQSLLDRCRERAPGYDRDNRFCQEDFDELKAAGYLLMAVPKEFGGLGFSLAAGAEHDPVHLHVARLREQPEDCPSAPNLDIV